MNKLNIINKIHYLFLKYSNFSLFASILTLSFLSLIFMSTASIASEYRINASTFLFLKKHIIFLICGIILMSFLSILNYNHLKIFLYFLFFLNLSLLITLPFIGSTIKGSSRWINLKFFTIQPSELLKPCFIFFNATLLNSNYFHYYFKLLFSFIFFAFLGFFIIIQPDFGMFLTFFFAWILQIFIFGIRIEFIALSTSSLATILFIGYKKIEYIHRRIDFFLSGTYSYQTLKAKSAIENGNIFGKGLGNGIFKYELPDCHTDYIFSVIFEEFGLILILFLIFIYTKIFHQSIKSIIKKEFDTILIIYGAISIILFQTFVNIFVNFNLLPSKGMTLPIISYGGSSMISSYIIFGIILNLTSPYKKKFITYYEAKYQQ